MQEIDFHGLTLEEAVGKADSIVANAYIQRDGPRVVKLITGRGELQNSVILYLTKLQVTWDYEIGNHGALIVDFTRE